MGCLRELSGQARVTDYSYHENTNKYSVYYISFSVLKIEKYKIRQQKKCIFIHRLIENHNVTSEIFHS